jgi:hypothetical protein
VIGLHCRNRLARDAGHAGELLLRQPERLAFLTKTIFD